MKSIRFISTQLYRCSCGQCFPSALRCLWFKQNWLSIRTAKDRIISIKLFHSISKQLNLYPENLYVVITSLLILLWGFFAVFFFCECGTILTTKFAMFDYELWQCDWHLFPFKMQQMLVFVMSNTQDPAMIYGYGNYECTRDTFKRVCLVYLLFSSLDGNKWSFLHVSIDSVVFFVFICVDNQSWILLFHDD